MTDGHCCRPPIVASPAGEPGDLLPSDPEVVALESSHPRTRSSFWVLQPVSALAAAAVLVSPRVFRAVTAVLAAALVVGICAAVVVLRWHYPTDALGGACVGIGAVLFLDGLAHLPWVMGARLGSLRRLHHREQPSAGWT